MSEYQSLIDELEGTLPFSDAQRRQLLLQRISDLFLAGSGRCSDEQLALFDDVLLRLCADIEVKARAALAHRFADVENAPKGLIRQLAFDDAIAVAGPVLAASPQLTDDDLVENASTRSQAHLYAIAQRLSLSEAVTDVLVERGNRRVVRSTAENRGARFSSRGYQQLVERAREDGGLALAMGRRNDVPRQYLLKLLESASASVRRKLMDANPLAAELIKDTVDEIAGDVRREAREASLQHAAALKDVKHRYNVQGITEADVHAAARAQQFERTAVALAALGSLPVDIVERALLDQGDNMILTVARAAGASWATAKALLLMHAAKRELSSDDLLRLGGIFERARPATAKRVLEYHQRRTLQRPATARDQDRNRDAAAAAVTP